MENLNLERPTGDFGFLFGQPAHPASAHLPARRPDPTRESSSLPLKADIREGASDVRFVPDTFVMLV